MESQDQSAQDPAKLESKLKIVLAYLACALIWGTTWYAIRVCIADGGYSIYPAIALRYTLSEIILAVCIGWLFWRKKTNMALLINKETPWILLTGAIAGFGVGLLYTAEKVIPGGLAAVISSTAPIIAVFLASGSRVENLSVKTLAGSVISLIGIILVFHDRMSVSPEHAGAIGLLVGNSFLNATSNVLMKKHISKSDAYSRNFFFFLSAAILVWSMAYFVGPCTIPSEPFKGTALAPTIALVHLTIPGTLVAFTLFFYLLKHTSLSKAMTLGFVTPVLALVVDAFWEKQAIMNLNTYAGLACVLMGVGLNIFLPQVKPKSINRSKVNPDS